MSIEAPSVSHQEVTPAWDNKPPTDELDMSDFEKEFETPESVVAEQTTRVENLGLDFTKPENPDAEAARAQNINEAFAAAQRESKLSNNPDSIKVEEASEATGVETAETNTQDDGANQETTGRHQAENGGIPVADLLAANAVTAAPESKASTTANALRSVAKGAENLADRFAEKGPAEMAKDAVRKVGRGAMNIARQIPTALKAAENFQRDHVDGKFPELVAKGYDAAKTRFNERRARKAQESAFDSYESNIAYTEHYDEAKAINEQKKAEQSAAYDSYAENIDFTKKREAQDKLQERRDAELKAKLARMAKERRDQRRQERWAKRGEQFRNAKDRVGKTRLGRIGRFLGRFVRGAFRAGKVASSYIAGAAKAVHQSGMENARATRAAYNTESPKS